VKPSNDQILQAPQHPRPPDTMKRCAAQAGCVQNQWLSGVEVRRTLENVARRKLNVSQTNGKVGNRFGNRRRTIGFLGNRFGNRCQTNGKVGNRYGYEESIENIILATITRSGVLLRAGQSQARQNNVLYHPHPKILNVLLAPLPHFQC
jgi:hypothetical protein